VSAANPNSFSLPRTDVVLGRTRPILWHLGQQNVAMDRTVRPIHGTRDIAVLHWIDMDVVRMPSEIIIVGDQMFPETTLTDAAPPFATAARSLSPLGIVREKLALISIQRVAQSQSSAGSVQTTRM
jgi:hypothetical protein